MIMSRKKTIKKSPITQMQKLYLNDILLRRADAYKGLINKIIKDIPDDYDKPKSIENDSLVGFLSKKIDIHVKRFNSIFKTPLLEKKVRTFIASKLKKDNQARYKKFINGNMSVKKHLQNLQAVQGIKTSDLIDNENLQEYMDNAISENVNLIKSMDNAIFDDIKNIVSKNVSGMIDKKQLTEKLLELGAKNEEKARQIAIDQTNKISENMNKQRSIGLGSKKFMWQSTGKNTVRSEHAQYDGKIFTWEKGAGPRGIRPGEDVNCQCTAIAIFDDEEE
jgi:SPP1 gp7 family putative phage head morphogenesis protein